MRSNRITTALLLSIAFFAMTNCDKKGSGKATGFNVSLTSSPP
jgi:hypothetical protein